MYLRLILGLVACVAGQPVFAEVQQDIPKNLVVLDAASAGDALIAVADRGLIFRYGTSSGPNAQALVEAHWWPQTSPAKTMLASIHMLDAMNGWVVGHDATILATTDGGYTWALKYENPKLEAPLFDIWFENAMHGIAVGAYGLMMETTDGGTTWDERRISTDEFHLYSITFLRNDALFAVGEAGAIFRSPDRGITWKPLESPYSGTFFGALALKDGGLLVYGLRGNLFRSDDGGTSWTALKTDTEASLLGATQRADGSVVVVGLSGTILTSADGRAFTRTTLADREALGGAVETASGKLLLLGEKGAHPWEAPR